MRDFALIQLTPGQLLFGWGPFGSYPDPPPPPAFYINDFFLSSERPWKSPARWDVVESARLRELFGPAHLPPIEWDPVDDDSFQSLFAAAHSAVLRGEFDKIVPVEFQTGRIASEAPLAPWLLSRLAETPPALAPYGWSLGEEGVLGATPEPLFSFSEGELTTMALAGTRSLARAHELLEDPKEQAEHQMVVEDIAAQLAAFGPPRIGPTSVVELPGLAHLRTVIGVRPSALPGFEEVVRALHPTAALGASPRNHAATNWLRNADKVVDRREFGAPFGAILPDGDALCMVGIRNVSWRGRQVRVGAGAGVLAGSRMEMERKELSRKRDQVRRLFGLEENSE
jgi:menaquinone-specific isochorismate synthase